MSISKYLQISFHGRRKKKSCPIFDLWLELFMRRRKEECICSPKNGVIIAFAWLSYQTVFGSFSRRYSLSPRSIRHHKMTIVPSIALQPPPSLSWPAAVAVAKCRWSKTTPLMSPCINQNHLFGRSLAINVFVPLWIFCAKKIFLKIPSFFASGERKFCKGSKLAAQTKDETFSREYLRI